MIDKVKNAGLIALTVLLCVAVGIGGYLFFINSRNQTRAEEARVTAQNRIAQLSRTVKENEITWSRLAQEKEADLGRLRELNEDLANRIEERDERITTLTEVNATLERVRVVVRRENVTQTTDPEDPERTRVEFDQVWEDFMRVSGFTLTNPAEAEIQLDYTRPARISVVTTQRPDLSWNTYVTTDIPNLEIGEIESVVSPISRPHEETSWTEGIYLGFGGGGGRETSEGGASGFGIMEVGYDFGDIEVGLLGMFNAWDGGTSPGVGLMFRINPFAL